MNREDIKIYIYNLLERNHISDSIKDKIIDYIFLNDDEKISENRKILSSKKGKIDSEIDKLKSLSKDLKDKIDIIDTTP